MKPLAYFLRQLKRFGVPQKTVRDSFIECVKEEVGAELSGEEIKISNKTLYINTSPVVKNEILLKRKILLQRMKEKTGGEHPYVNNLS
jgi:hypothetical protein